MFIFLVQHKLYVRKCRNDERVIHHARHGSGWHLLTGLNALKLILDCGTVTILTVQTFYLAFIWRSWLAIDFGCPVPSLISLRHKLNY